MREDAFCSNGGLLRDGPQYVGCLNPSWMSIKSKAVFGGICEDAMFAVLTGNSAFSQGLRKNNDIHVFDEAGIKGIRSCELDFQDKNLRERDIYIFHD